MFGRTARLAAIALVTVALASAQALNSASFRLPGMPGFGVGRGSMFVLFGSGLGPAGLEKAPSLPLGATLAGTSVQVIVGARSAAALIYYTSATQVAAVMPSTMPAGDGIATLTFNGRTSNAIAIHVVESGFGIFARNQAGFGPGIVQNYIDATNAPTNALNASLTPGQTAVVWGTGLGPISGSDAGIPPVGNIGSDTTVLIGGKTVTPAYAGRSGSYPAIDQINFKLPEDVTGCYVPLAVKTGGVVSNFVSVSVAANGGTCSDITSYVAADIDKAAANGTSRIAAVLLTSITQYTPVTGATATSESGSAEFRSRSLDAFLSSRGPMPPVPPLGTCAADTFQMVASDPGRLNPPDTAASTPLNAGLAVAVKGVSMPALSNGLYAGQLPTGTLVPGSLTVQGGRSGTDVDSFAKAITLPQTITWTNISNLAGTSIPRTQPLQVTWSGGDGAREFVVVRGISTTQAGDIRGSFTCSEAVATGSLTVSADVLSVLPAGVAGGPDFLEIGTATRLDTSRFDANGLDGGYIQVRRLQRTPVVFQ